MTDVNPNLRINHNGEYVGGYLDLGGFGESFARNSDLNFFGTANTLYLNLDNSVKKFLPNGSLFITDYVRYTPTPPGFSAPVAGTSPGSPVNIQNVYAQGLLAYRTNNVTNSGSVQAGYDISPVTNLNASYLHNIIRFGSSPLSSGAVLFDTTTQTGSVGASTKLSARDTLNANYSHTQSDFVPQSTSVPSSSIQSSRFLTDTATLGFSRSLTPYLTAQAGGGVIVIDPGLTTYALNASMMLNTTNHIATISYARTAYPSYVGIGATLISDTVSLSAVQKLALQWELNETANYSHASGGTGANLTAYTSYFASMDLYYYVTTVWATALSVDYLNFHQEFGATKTDFDRYTVTFSVKATWN